jgi:hypothetical protein
VDKKNDWDQPKWNDGYNTTQNYKKILEDIISTQVGTVQKLTGKEKNAFEMIAVETCFFKEISSSKTKSFRGFNFSH